MNVSIEAKVEAPLRRVWSAWTTPADIMQWNFASDDWCCPQATLDLQPGGKFSYRMEATDGATGFDFEGEFKNVVEGKLIEFNLLDERPVEVLFTETDGGVVVKVTFEAEEANPAEQQRQGWQSILNNFKKHVEG